MGFAESLYPKAELTLPRQDWNLLIAEAKGAKSVLEFGPGVSTYAWLEAGIEKIVSLECDDEWLELKKKQFADYPRVAIRKYYNEPIVRAESNLGQYDLAFVDSPSGYTHPVIGRKPPTVHKGQEDCSRFNTCAFALEHAPVVLLHDACRPRERATLGRLRQLGHRWEYLPLGRYGGLARIVRHA